MDRTRILRGIGALGVIAGVRPLWWGIQRPICPNLSSGGSRAPNPHYLIPGLLFLLIGIGLISYAYRRPNRSGTSPAEE